MYQLYNCLTQQYSELGSQHFEGAVDEAFGIAREQGGWQFIVYDEQRNPVYHFYT